MKVLTTIQTRFDQFLDGITQKKPTGYDVLILSLFTIFITFQPYYIHGKINLFEIGLYLPGINAILAGEFPYRDFYHLRGPLELYVPAWLMQIFGVHINVLYTFFYLSNILCLIMVIAVAKEILTTRLMLYLFTLPFIGRTFIRVVYQIWGGMRYVWGLASVFCVVRFFKSRNLGWMLAAGVTSALGSLTSIEAGVYVFLGVVAALICALIFRVMSPSFILKAAGYYIGGLAVVGLPFLAILFGNHALGAYCDITLSTVFNMQKVIDPHLVSVYPRNFIEALIAMTNPWSINFKHMTPSYVYIFLLVYLGSRARRKIFTASDLCLVLLGVYGFVMYNTGFRGLWAAQFEMSLMPEKVLYFFLLEVFLLFALAKREQREQREQRAPTGNRSFSWRVVAGLFAVALILSSVGYGIQRFSSRFVAFKFLMAKISGKSTAKLRPLHNEKSAQLTMERAKGILVPEYQEKELEKVVSYLKQNSSKNDIVFTYPDLGAINFLADRPFLGRFPLITFSWFNDKWHEEIMADLEKQDVKFVILQKKMTPDWYQVYLGFDFNRRKYDEMMRVFNSKFQRVYETDEYYFLSPRKNY